MSHISKDEFEKMRKAYDSKNPGKTKAVHFDLAAISQLTSTPGAAGVRVYFGVDDQGNDTVMLVPTDALGNNIYESIQDRGQLCPPYCPE